LTSIAFFLNQGKFRLWEVASEKQIKSTTYQT